MAILGVSEVHSLSQLQWLCQRKEGQDMISYPASYHSIAVKCGIRNRFMRWWWRFSYYYIHMIQKGDGKDDNDDDGKKE